MNFSCIISENLNLWLIHVNVWQKPLQYCKVISLQLIKINEKKKKRVAPPSLTWRHSFSEYAYQVIPKYSVYFHNKSYFSDYVFISLYDIFSNYSHKYITYKQVYIITILMTIASTINRFDGKHN